MAAVPVCVDRALAAHGHHHGGDVGANHLVRQDELHLLDSLALVIVQEQQTRLQLVADEAVELLQEIPPLGGDGHVGHQGEELGVVLLGQLEDLLDDVLVQVHLEHHGIGLGEDLVALALQQAHQGIGVGTLGDGARHVAVVVKDRQPQAQSVGPDQHMVAVDLVLPELGEHILAHGAVVNDAQVGGAQLHIGDVLDDVSGNTAVDVFHPAHIPSGGDIGILREALDVHKGSSDDYDAHISVSPFSCAPQGRFAYYTIFRPVAQPFPMDFFGKGHDCGIGKKCRGDSNKKAGRIASRLGFKRCGPCAGWYPPRSPRIPGRVLPFRPPP